jgi:hypothetical protein
VFNKDHRRGPQNNYEVERQTGGNELAHAVKWIALTIMTMLCILSDGLSERRGGTGRRKDESDGVSMSHQSCVYILMYASACSGSPRHFCSAVSTLIYLRIC